MNLNLANPIVFFDLETTGINIAKDRIVEISVLKVSERQGRAKDNPGESGNAHSRGSIKSAWHL